MAKLSATAQPYELILKNTSQRVDITVFDDQDPPEPVDAESGTLRVLRLNDNVVYQESDFVGSPQRVVNSGTGKYYIEWGDDSATANTPTQTETNTARTYLFHWQFVGVSGSEQINALQTVDVVTAKSMSLLGAFRAQIDKACKEVDTDPSNLCPLGYSDGDLYRYLCGGLSLINAEQPYPTFATLDNYPMLFSQLLFDAGLIVGINAQTLFAIDTDVAQWNDQGNSWVLTHQPMLASFNNALAAQLERRVKSMKLHLVRSGVQHVQASTNYRLQTLISAAPSGSVFRNMFVA